MTVLREAVDSLQIDLARHKEEMTTQVEDLNKKVTQASSAAAAQNAPNSHAQAAEAAELLVKVRTVEKELGVQQQRLTEFIHRSVQERRQQQQSPRRDLHEGTDFDDPTASFSTIVHPHAAGGVASPRSILNAANSAVDGPMSPIVAAVAGVSVAEDSTLTLPRTTIGRSLNRPTRAANRGLSFTLPPKMWVYERMTGDPRECVMKKRLHCITLGHSADVNVPGEVCFLFAAVEASRQPNLHDVIAEAARNRTGAPGVTCIPSTAVLAMDIRPAPREIIESMGPAAGDGTNLLVSIYRSTAGSGYHASGHDGGSNGPGSPSAGASRGAAGGWGATSEFSSRGSHYGGASNNDGTGGASAAAAASGGTGVTRRGFLSRNGGSTGGPSTSDKPFVLFLPSSLAVDEWVSFVSQLLGDRVKIAEGAGSEAHFLDL